MAPGHAPSTMGPKDEPDPVRTGVAVECSDPTDAAMPATRATAPLSRIGQLALQSLQRLHQLGSDLQGEGPAPVHSSVDPRTADVKVPLSVVLGRSVDRGNPRRPGAMRGVETGNNPAGTNAMHIEAA